MRFVIVNAAHDSFIFGMKFGKTFWYWISAAIKMMDYQLFTILIHRLPERATRLEDVPLWQEKSRSHPS